MPFSPRIAARIRHPSLDRSYGPRSGPDCRVVWTAPTEGESRESHRLAHRAGHREGTETMAEDAGGPFEFRGVNHLALVCRDMERTVDFYTNVLGMPLVKTIELPAGMGQHFFFDCGGGDCLAFFWFPDAPEGIPGVSAPRAARSGRAHERRRLDEPRRLQRPGREDRRVPRTPRSPAASTAPKWPTTTTPSGASATSCTPACSSAASTSKIPMGSCSNSPAGLVL